MRDVPRELPRSGRPVWSAVQSRWLRGVGGASALGRPSWPSRGQRLQGRVSRCAHQGPGSGSSSRLLQEWRGPPPPAAQTRCPLCLEAMAWALQGVLFPVNTARPVASHLPPTGTVSTWYRGRSNLQRVAPWHCREPPAAPALTCCVRHQMGRTTAPSQAARGPDPRWLEGCWQSKGDTPNSQGPAGSPTPQGSAKVGPHPSA